MEETKSLLADPQVQEAVGKMTGEVPAAKKPRKAPAKKAATSVDSDAPKESVAPEVKKAPVENKNPALCQHPNLKKDKYGKDIVTFVQGKGMVAHCASCGIKITSFHTTAQPQNHVNHGKVHMSKKDRRLGKKLRQEFEANGKKA